MADASERSRDGNGDQCEDDSEDRVPLRDAGRQRNPGADNNTDGDTDDRPEFQCRAHGQDRSAKGQDCERDHLKVTARKRTQTDLRQT